MIGSVAQRSVSARLARPLYENSFRVGLVRIRTVDTSLKNFPKKCRGTLLVTSPAGGPSEDHKEAIPGFDSRNACGGRRRSARIRAVARIHSCSNRGCHVAFAERRNRGGEQREASSGARTGPLARPDEPARGSRRRQAAVCRIRPVWPGCRDAKESLITRFEDFRI